MAIQVLHDPRRYLLVVMAVALIVVVPLMFLFVTLIGMLVEPGPGGDTVNGWIIPWALFGLGVAALVFGALVMIARGTRQADLEHEPPRPDARRLP